MGNRASTFLCLSLFATCAAGQIVTPYSDPLAISLAQKSVVALAGGQSLSDVVITASVYWFAGSDSETGSVVLKTTGPANGRMDFELTRGPRSLIRNNSSGAPEGAWTGTFARAVAQHNCLTDANWFFPYFSLLPQRRPDEVFTYVGRDIRDGLTVEHVRSYRLIGKHQTVASIFARLTTMDFFLDPTSFLPVVITFSEHPDNDINIDEQVEIRFSSYKSYSGIQIPTRIRQFVNGGLHLDMSLTNVSFNAGLQDSDFQIH